MGDHRSGSQPNDPAAPVGILKVDVEAAHRETGERLLPYFAYEHLPPKLQEISRQFALLAVRLCTTLPSHPERTVALRKLLESKDCAVRAALE